MFDDKEVDLIEIKRGKWMTRDEAIRKGYNFLALSLAESRNRTTKNASIWGAAGIEPILVLALSLYIMSWIVPVIKSGVDAVVEPVAEALGATPKPPGVYRVIDRR